MRTLPLPWRLLGLALAFALTGCATAPLPAPETGRTPAHFARAPDTGASAPASTVSTDAWWHAFGDTSLDAIERTAMSANTQIQQAAARVAKARALAQAAGAARLPHATLIAGASRQGGPLVNAAGTDGNLFTAGASLGYELDIAGRVSQSTQAAVLDAQEREALWRHTQLQVQAEVASTWLSLQALDQQRALARAVAASQRDTVALLDGKARAGLASPADAATARAEAGALEAQALTLDRDRATLQHALAFLMGANFADVAGTFAPDPLASTGADASVAGPATVPSIPPGIPSDVLSRRPDVAAAERAMQAARRRLGVAETAWLPSITLTASGGLASSELGELLRTAARSWGIAGLLALPLFDGGRRDAAVASAKADLEAAAANWQGQMLSALREVEDHLATLRVLGAQASALTSAEQASAQALVLTQSRLARGLASPLDVEESRRRALRDRLATARVQQARQVTTVGLVRALGGGWPSSPHAALAVHTGTH